MIPLLEWPRAIFRRLHSISPIKLSLFVVLTMAVAVLFILKPWEEAPKPQKVARTSDPDIITVEQADIGAITEVANAFANATDIETRLSLSRKPGETRTMLGTFSDEAREEVPTEVIPIALANSLTGFSFSMFKATFEGGNERIIYVVPTDDGLRVDWQAYARAASKPWDDIAAGTAGDVLVRVVVEPSNYYNYRFSDDSAWASFSLRSPELDFTLNGYVKRNSPDHARLVQIVQSVLRATIRIRSDFDIPEHQQCEILETVAADWAVPD